MVDQIHYSEEFFLVESKHSPFSSSCMAYSLLLTVVVLGFTVPNQNYYCVDKISCSLLKYFFPIPCLWEEEETCFVQLQLLRDSNEVHRLVSPDQVSSSRSITACKNGNIQVLENVNKCVKSSLYLEEPSACQLSSLPLHSPKSWKESRAFEKEPVNSEEWLAAAFTLQGSCGWIGEPRLSQPFVWVQGGCFTADSFEATTHFIKCCPCVKIGILALEI